MEIKPQDYLHFYVGQWVTVTSLSGSAIEAGFELGRYALNFEMLHYILSDRMGIRNSLELRPLSDMTEEESAAMQKLFLEMADNDKAQGEIWADQTRHMLKQGFDLFGLIPAGLAIDKTSLI